jgi:hypothetical protein
MRFFSGTRDSGKKGAGKSASEAYRNKIAADKGEKKAVTQDEIYKKIIEERMAKMMEDYMLGKKKNAVALPGTKQDDGKPKEVSKGTLMVIKMMAMKREAKERKMEKKRDLAFLRDKKAKAWEENKIKLQAEALIKQKEAEYYAEQARNNENKDSWW